MSRVRNLPALLFLFAALLLGGSAQGVWGIFLLQCGGIALLVWSFNGRSHRPMGKWARRLMLLAALAVVLIAVQIVPLPVPLWTALPGRQFVLDGLTLLGEQPRWMSLSLAPYATLAAGLTLIVPIALFVALVRRRDTSQRLVVAALLAGTLAGCLLGVMQIASNGKDWYPYRISAFGASTGFFANSNHLGTLLLASAPFLVAVAAQGVDSNRDAQARGVIKAMALAAGVVLVVSIGLNGSLAVQLLGLPVALACIALLAWGRAPGQRRALAVTAAVVIASAAAIVALAFDRIQAGNQESLATRAQIWSTSLRALDESGAAGSGIGTFVQYYRRFEDPAAVTPTFVNHAHNDYLEIIVEAGVPGAVLLVLFLSWWAVMAVHCWRSARSDIYARAATVASATILLHSLVDYPLRTSAIAAVFATSLALMCLRPSVALNGERSELRPARHRAIR